MLAIGNGFSKAGQLELALPWAEKAAAKLERRPGPAQPRRPAPDPCPRPSPTRDRAEQLQARALAEYDTVLAAQPDDVEAVNNKAWILHSYRGRSQAALELAQGLPPEGRPRVLPGEFYDTLGSIQEALGNGRDAEESYKKGLGKSPEHPVLNFHMGQPDGRRQVQGPARPPTTSRSPRPAGTGSPPTWPASSNSLLQQVGE